SSLLSLFRFRSDFFKFVTAVRKDVEALYALGQRNVIQVLLVDLRGSLLGFEHDGANWNFKNKIRSFLPGSVRMREDKSGENLLFLRPEPPGIAAWTCIRRRKLDSISAARIMTLPPSPPSPDPFSSD